MKLIPQENPDIPKLAWLCTFSQGADEINLEHGRAVDIRDSFFFEGAWAGDFESGGFLTAPCFGTGGQVDKDGVTFTPPDHILDRLYSLRRGETLYVSNSLAMILARTDTSLMTNRSDYPVLFSNIRFGLEHAISPMPLANGETVQMWAWHHLHVAPDLTTAQREKSRSVPTTDYAAYIGYFTDQIASVFANGADPARAQTLTPMSTISSGYDSTMISALAADHGCKDAITFSKTRAKMGKPAEDDSGAEASRILGLNVKIHDRLGFRDSDAMPEIETLGAGAEMSSARSDLENRVLLTGYMGDTMWDLHPKAVSTYIYWPVIAGHNFTELRLGAGFAHFCLPFMGCRQQPEIIAISQSDEMKPWSIDSPYNRPICRRVAEERGIPREAFGIKKRATGVFFREEGLAETMTPHSYEDYTAFRQTNVAIPEWRITATDKWIRTARFLNSALGKATGALNKGLKTKLAPPQLPATPGLSSEGAVLFQWSVERMKARYGQSPQK